MNNVELQGKYSVSQSLVRNAGRGTGKLILKPLYISLLLAFAGAAMPSFAQVVKAASEDEAKKQVTEVTTDEKLRNGFGETLKPKVKRPANVLNQPYTPIKKQDDQSQIPEIEMFVGESRVFPTPGVARIAVGNGQIMTAAALDNKEVIIFANAVGTSSLFVWNEDGRYQRIKVNIVAGDTTRVAREIAAFLTAIPHTKASIVGDKVIVEGEQLSNEDLEKIETLGKIYPQIVNFTSKNTWEQMVMLDVKVVEFPKNELRELGLKWNAMGGATIGGIWGPIHRGNDAGYTTNIQTGTSGLPLVNPDGSATGIPVPTSLHIRGVMNLGIGAQLALMNQQGKASILAEPQLSTRSGGSASFLAGGEFPYAVSNLAGVTVVFKPYGIKLLIDPKVDRNGAIQAKIETEVSKIDTSVTSAAGPALLTRNTKTQFNVRDGETIVLAGLISRDTSTNIDKVPLLGDLPVLGALFRSKRFQNNETELVIFVTPTVINSKSPGLVERVQRTTERLQDELGRAPYLTNPLQPDHDPAKTNSPAAIATPKPNAVTQPAGVIPVTQTARIETPSTSNVVPANKNPFAAKEPSAKGGSALRVTRDGLVIRSEPSSKSEALLQLGLGSVVQLGAGNLRHAEGRNWRNVVVGNIEGWVIATGVEPSHLAPNIKPYTKSSLSRQDQGGSPLSLGTAPKGQPVSPGASRTVSVKAEEDVASGKIQRFRVALDKLAMRVTPDINAPIVQNLQEGQIVEAMTLPPHNNWTAVKVDGKSGWVATQWLEPKN